MNLFSECINPTSDQAPRNFARVFSLSAQTTRVGRIPRERAGSAWTIRTPRFFQISAHVILVAPPSSAFAERSNTIIPINSEKPAELSSSGTKTTRPGGADEIGISFERVQITGALMQSPPQTTNLVSLRVVLKGKRRSPSSWEGGITLAPHLPSLLKRGS